MEPGPYIGGYRAPNPCLSSDELARAEVPYLLRMSIGYARVGDGVDTWQDLLRAADAELYRVKREKKKAGAQIR